MSEVFARAYADSYDALYADKDYAVECDLIERVAKEYAAKPVHGILDLGCGTGGHSSELAARGYEVTGVDRSANMLARARQNAPAGTSIDFVTASIETLDLRRTFDLAAMMFSVLGYLVSDDDVSNGLRAARRHLEPGGIFVFDCWYGPAVLEEQPSDRTKTVTTPAGHIIRRATSTLHPERDVCVVDYSLERFEGDTLVEQFEERHILRYFDQPTLRKHLEQAGFDLVRLGGFPNLDEEPNTHSWNVTGVARAIGDDR